MTTPVKTINDAKASGRAAFRAGMLRAPSIDKSMCKCYGRDKAPVEHAMITAWREGYDIEAM